MADSRPVFSAHDGWIIDIFTSIALGGVAALVLSETYKAIFRFREESAGGGVAGLLAAIFAVWALTRLRKARAARDVEASANGEADAPPAGRARKSGR
ncbi:MAG: hypothetical protein O7H41_06060 [Planctomycetota bacterium]|nr:hypothetical protein [Planctomycetota bacterium]